MVQQIGVTNMNKRIEVKDWANKHNTFVYTSNMNPLGYVHCEAATEWSAYNASGEFIGWYGSKKEAKAAL